MLRLTLTVAVLLASAAFADDSETSAPPFEVAGENRISVSVSHHFAKSEALERLGYLLDYWKRAFDIRFEWQGNQVFISGSIFGLKVKARMSVTDEAVVAVAADPGWPWRGRAEGYVTGKLKKYMHPTYDDP